MFDLLRSNFGPSTNISNFVSIELTILEILQFLHFGVLA